MDHTRGRVPYPPQPHFALTMRTDQGVSSSALPIALAVGHWCDDLDRSLDNALHLGPGVMNHALDLLKRLGGLHPVIAYPLEPFGKHMLHLCGEVNYVAKMTQMADLLRS